jgi:hypothetical protein
MNVPTQYGNKTHCTANNPPGSPHPGGDYTCPQQNGGLYCPGNDAGGSGPWQCHADDVTGQLTCDSGPGTSSGTGGTGGGGGSTTGGWQCTTNPDGSQTCYNPDCSQSPSGEFGCSNGGSPIPPGPTPPGGWTCVPGPTGGEICTSPPTSGGTGGAGGGTGGTGGSGGAPPGSNCPMIGQQRWCDGQTFCSWGKQTCVQSGSSYRWGTCVEGNPNAPPNPAPNTACSCYYPFSYNPQCCENSGCIVVGERPVPCGTVNGGGLCAPCGDDNNCATGGICVRKLHYVPDTPNGGNSIGVVEQFCSHSCNTAGDCGTGYNCVQPSGSPTKFCVPTAGSCQ